MQQAPAWGCVDDWTSGQADTSAPSSQWPASHRVPTPCPVRHWGPQIDTAMEASLGAPGHWPRTELDDEDYPQGGWDMVFLVALLLLGLPANGLMAWLAGSQARQGAGTRLALLLLSLALSDFLFLAAARLPLWVCAGVWVLATLFSVPWLVFPEAAVWWYDLVICLDFWDSEELPLRMLEILGGFLPFLVLLICHLLTQAAACRPCRRHQPGAPACRGFARVAKTILSAYVVLRLPYQLAQLLYLAFLWDFYPGYLLWEALVYSDYLILLNSCLSPFLCLLASADLRALLHTMLASFAAALCEERPGSFMPAEPQTQVDSEDQTVPGPVAEAQPQLDSGAQSQASPKAQPPGPTTSSAPSACEEASSTPAMDSTLEAPVNLATPAASEGGGPSSAPREEAPGAGPT
ncbi:hypothetical protein K5549_013560 [Capra hircus]|nr:hypothetical protein K5549_013560 [Capra hircus]